MSLLYQNCGRVHEAVDLPLKNSVQNVGKGTPFQNFLSLQMESTYEPMHEWEKLYKIYFWKCWNQNYQSYLT